MQPKDTDPISLDTIDLESDWVVEESSPDLSWLDEDTRDLSDLPSHMETPNTHASQLLQPSDVGTSSMRAYCRRSHPWVMKLKIVMRQSFIIYDICI